MGVKGALLILLSSFKIKIKSLPPSGSSTHLPPLRGGRDGYCRGILEVVLLLPPRSGGSCPEWG